MRSERRRSGSWSFSLLFGKTKGRKILLGYHTLIDIPYRQEGGETTIRSSYPINTTIHTILIMLSCCVHLAVSLLFDC